MANARPQSMQERTVCHFSVNQVFYTIHELRREVAHRLAHDYGQFDPLYRLLQAFVNAANQGDPSFTQEKHGAIRLASRKEWKQWRKICAAMGMYAVNAYPLNQLPGNKALPIVGTAFRPVTGTDISPFRMFTSLFEPDGFFDHDPELMRSIRARQQEREPFPQQLLELAEQAVSEGGLSRDLAEIFVNLLAGTLQMSQDPVGRELYDSLKRDGSDVAADVLCFNTPHLNHLTPGLDPTKTDIRMVADKINELFRIVNQCVQASDSAGQAAIEEYLISELKRPAYAELNLTPAALIEMAELRRQVEEESAQLRGESIQEDKTPDHRGLSLIKVQGPLAPLIQLKQVSYKGIPRQVSFKYKGGPKFQGRHMAPFGEIEIRYIALTEEGRECIAGRKGVEAFNRLCSHLQGKDITSTELHDELEKYGYGFYTYSVDSTCLNRLLDSGNPLPITWEACVAQGIIKRDWIRYEDFLAASAAGIFQGNLTTAASPVAEGKTETRPGHLKPTSSSPRDMDSFGYFRTNLGVEIPPSDYIYARQMQESIEAVCSYLAGYGMNITYPSTLKKTYQDYLDPAKVPLEVGVVLDQMFSDGPLSIITPFTEIPTVLSEATTDSGVTPFTEVPTVLSETTTDYPRARL